jgi:hypothetical protein
MTQVKHGTTDRTEYFKMVDSSTGQPETGLTVTNMDATYVRNRADAVKNDLTALSAPDDAHADNQAIEVDATNAPGLYRVDFPDAAFASGADKVILIVTCAGCDPAMKEIELVANTAEDVFARLGAPAGASHAADIATRASQASVDDVPTNAELATALAAADDAVLTEVALVKAKTDNLPSDPADQSLIIAATDAIMTRLGLPTGASLAADIAARASQASVDDLPTNAELATALAAADDAVLAQIAVVAAAIAALPTAAAIADAVQDEAVEGAYTQRQLLRLIAAALLGKVSGFEANAPVFRNLADSADRITATCDADGNRTAVTLNAA